MVDVEEIGKSSMYVVVFVFVCCVFVCVMCFVFFLRGGVLCSDCVSGWVRGCVCVCGMCVCLCVCVCIVRVCGTRESVCVRVCASVSTYKLFTFIHATRVSVCSPFRLCVCVCAKFFMCACAQRVVLCSARFAVSSTHC